MKYDFWAGRWAEGRIGFHRGEVHPDLVEHAASWFGTAPKRVLVPLCGKTLDLVWLANTGYQVVGVEFVEEAVRAFFDEQGLAVDSTEVGEFSRFRSGSIEIIRGDWFALTPDIVGEVDAVWDRAAMVALPADRLRDYAAKVAELCGAGTPVLHNVVEYSPADIGPPFSVSKRDIESAYLGLEVEEVTRRSILSEAKWAVDREWADTALYRYRIA